MSAAPAFPLRSKFVYDKVINWFPGHMAKGLRVMREKLASVDLIVEARDARISYNNVNYLLLVRSCPPVINSTEFPSSQCLSLTRFFYPFTHPSFVNKPPIRTICLDER